VGTLLRYSPSLFRTPICCTVITRNKNCNKATKIGNWNKINQQFQLNNALFLSIFIFCFLATIWEIRVFLSERATQYSCHFHKPVPFCVLTSTSIENARSHKYAVTNKRTSRVNIVIRGYHSIRWHQNIWRYLVLKVCFLISLSWRSMMPSMRWLFIPAVVMSKTNGCLIHAEYCRQSGK